MTESIESLKKKLEEIEAANKRNIERITEHDMIVKVDIAINDLKLYRSHPDIINNLIEVQRALITEFNEKYGQITGEQGKKEEKGEKDKSKE